MAKEPVRATRTGKERPIDRAQGSRTLTKHFVYYFEPKITNMHVSDHTGISFNEFSIFLLYDNFYGF
jgi:hypothetical protein